MDAQARPFSLFRSIFWPVYKHECKFFIPLLVIFFLICFNYNVLRAAKDALIVTAPYSGAETLPFLKVWAILPMAVLITFVYTKISNRFNREQVFYIMVSLFLGFFFLFAFILYPLRDFLHPHELCNKLETFLPLGCRGLVALFRNWTYTLFYAMAELWNTAIMTVLFWGFANEIISVKEARRFYAILAMCGNISGIVAGAAVTFFSNTGVMGNSFFHLDAWGCSLLFLTSLFIVTCFGILLMFRWFNEHALNHYLARNGQRESSPKVLMSLRKNFVFLAKSRYLICIALIVITYNICINLTEVVWKDQVQQLYPNPNHFNAYMGKVLIGIGVAATFISLISGMILQKCTWKFSALIPPIILLITGALFFGFLLFKGTAAAVGFTLLGFTAPTIGVFFGSLQNCFSRASKYSLFDTTKELAFIPLSKESKQKGKAAIDGVGSRLGKSGGAVVFQALLMMIGTVSLTIPYIGVILLVCLGVWIWGVSSLGKQFNTLVNQGESMTISEEPSSQETTERLTNALQ